MKKKFSTSSFLKHRNVFVQPNSGVRVLVIGPNEMTKDVKVAWPGAEIVEVSPEDFGKAPEVRPIYDHVVLVNVLNRVALHDVGSFLAKAKTALSPKGTVHIAVPSLEWGARMVLSENPSPGVLMHIFGIQAGPETFSLSGWTMRSLRKILEELGYRVTLARRDEYAMVIGQTEAKADQHYVEAILGGYEPPKE